MPAGSTQTRRRRYRGGASGKRTAALSIPELKSAFDTLNEQTAALLKKGASSEETTRKFQTLWRNLFHKPVSKGAAEAYLKLKKASMSGGGISGSGTRKTRKQRGGMAPVDHMTRQGVDGVYGNFPNYLTSGLSFYNSINQNGQFQECGTKDFTPIVPADMGSNKVGGGALGGEPSVPPSLLDNVYTYFQGKQLPPGPAPNQNRLTVV